MMAGIEVKRCIKLTCDGQKPVYIDDVTVVDGAEFVEFSTRDHTLCRFLVGHSDKPLRRSSALEKLKQLRLQATASACCEAEPGLFADTPADESVSLSKRRRKDLREKQEKDEVPPIVTVNLPALDQATDGDGYAMRMLSSLDTKKSVAFELTAQNVNYLKRLLTNDENIPPERITSNITGVRWRKDRAAWLATKTLDDKVMSKSFKPVNNSVDELDRAQAKAAQWVASSDPAPLTDGGVV